MYSSQQRNIRRNSMFPNFTGVSDHYALMDLRTGPDVPKADDGQQSQNLRSGQKLAASKPEFIP
jgi:hypothetical protein